MSKMTENVKKYLRLTKNVKKVQKYSKFLLLLLSLSFLNKTLIGEQRKCPPN